MIAKDFIIDFRNKRIICNPTGSETKYTVNEFYSFLQDTFDEPQNMTFEIPIEAESKSKYFLINGWKIDLQVRKHLKQGTLIEKV